MKLRILCTALGILKGKKLYLFINSFLQTKTGLNLLLVNTVKILKLW